MEWYQEVFRVLSLVVVWAIPSVLLLALFVFIIISPAFTISGVVLRLYDSVRNRIAKKTSVVTRRPQVATRHPIRDTAIMDTAASGSSQEDVIPERAVDKEPVVTKI